eukprot:7036609-Prymnesium_polylepis.1
MVVTRRNSSSPAQSLPSDWVDPVTPTMTLSELQVAYAFQQSECADVIRERDELVAARDAWITERGQLTGERDRLQQERAALVASPERSLKAS